MSDALPKAIIPRSIYNMFDVMNRAQAAGLELQRLKPAPVLLPIKRIEEAQK